MTSIHELLNITTQSKYTHRYFCIKPSIRGIEYDHLCYINIYKNEEVSGYINGHKYTLKLNEKESKRNRIVLEDHCKYKVVLSLENEYYILNVNDNTSSFCILLIYNDTSFIFNDNVVVKEDDLKKKGIPTYYIEVDSTNKKYICLCNSKDDQKYFIDNFSGLGDFYKNNHKYMNDNFKQI